MLNCCGHSGVYHRFEAVWPAGHFVLYILEKHLYVPGMQWPCWLSARNPIWWPATSETKSLGKDASYKSPKSEMVGRWWCSLKEVFGFMVSNVSAFSKGGNRNIHVASSLTCGQVHKLNLRPDLACIVVVYFVCFLLILSNFYVGFGHFQKYSWDGLGRRVTTVDSCWSGFMLGLYHLRKGTPRRNHRQRGLNCLSLCTWQHTRSFRQRQHNQAVTAGRFYCMIGVTLGNHTLILMPHFFGNLAVYRGFSQRFEN